jgi:predicted phage baseplate assembly protein
MEENGRAYIRFGDGILGLRPAPRSVFTAAYRIGNGTQGNVGADSLTRLVTTLTGIPKITNPLAATGGVAPEPMDQVRLFAPDAFRSQQRAVTLGDWEAAAQLNSQVQRAAASRRWTGSWYTVFLTVDRAAGREVTAEFEALLRAELDRYRMAGIDLEIDAPRFVALDLFFTVCVKAGYLRASVKKALLDAFSNRDLPDGTRGFFHPDNFTFGQPVYLSQIVATAMEVPGVEWIDTSPSGPTPARFQRYGEPAHGEIAEGRITFDRLEIPRLDNDTNQPENGRIDFLMRGGL